MRLNELQIGDWVNYYNAPAEVIFVNHRSGLVTIWDTATERYLETSSEKLHYKSELPHSPLHAFDNPAFNNKVA